MTEIKFRCSSIGKLMTEPKTQKEGPLSVGAKTWIRELAAQEIFGVDFEVTSREMEKGIVCEPDSIALLNRVRGLALQKNTERRTDAYFTGECDLFNADSNRGHDLKTSWSLKTFPIALADCKDKVYEYQMRAYMRLWNAASWSVDYCMVNTPENLIGYEPMSMHFVDHVPERMRVTSWVVVRDMEIEALMVEKIKHARHYYAEVIEEFDRTHGGELAAPLAFEPPAPRVNGRVELPASIF